ncbi:hypothetical protein V7114_04805 [Neobacillus niacini]|uniref:hypothetical protein n=1 Tax=Neobacillus niacini TaxID=86668 RepID=UPI002FFEB33A
MFNQKAQKKDMDDWERQILRINAIEVQMKGLLEFEKQIRSSMYSNSSREKKEQERAKTQGRNIKGENKENASDVNPLPKEEGNKVDERLIHFIEQLISEKNAVFLQREKQFVKKIQVLENQISILNDRINVLCAEPSKSEESRQTPSEDCSTHPHPNEKREEKEVFYKQIEKRVQLLEYNFLLINEVQAGLLNRMEELLEKSNVLMKLMDETEGSIKNKEPILQTLYIDKLYLEKYEQNNNFSQLGIKNLSGALNIGATYGKEAIPKVITEQVKENMAKIKEMKKDMANKQPVTNQPDDLHHEESSSEPASSPSEENVSYTDIVIEDDDPSMEEDSF